MPNSQSAKKRMRQSLDSRERNRSRRSVVKTRIRKFLEAVHDKDGTRATQEYRAVTKVLDQTAAKGTYHKNTVARKKSRLAARLNALLHAGTGTGGDTG